MPRKFTVRILAPHGDGHRATGGPPVRRPRAAGDPHEPLLRRAGDLRQVPRPDRRAVTSPSPSEREAEFLRAKKVRPGLSPGLPDPGPRRPRRQGPRVVPARGRRRSSMSASRSRSAPIPLSASFHSTSPRPSLSDPVSAVESIERKIGKRLRLLGGAAALAAAVIGPRRRTRHRDHPRRPRAPGRRARRYNEPLLRGRRRHRHEHGRGRARRPGLGKKARAGGRRERPGSLRRRRRLEDHLRRRGRREPRAPRRCPSPADRRYDRRPCPRARRRLRVTSTRSSPPGTRPWAISSSVSR